GIHWIKRVYSFSDRLVQSCSSERRTDDHPGGRIRKMRAWAVDSGIRLHTQAHVTNGRSDAQDLPGLISVNEWLTKRVFVWIEIASDIRINHQYCGSRGDIVVLRSR